MEEASKDPTIKVKPIGKRKNKEGVLTPHF
jgi:hypothetical protein